jgi:hypothetical protein
VSIGVATADDEASGELPASCAFWGAVCCGADGFGEQLLHERANNVRGNNKKAFGGIDAFIADPRCPDFDLNLWVGPYDESPNIVHISPGDC